MRGKYFFQGDRKVWIRGATYGAFLADDDGREYTDLAKVDRDFAMMAASGLNAVRIPHTTPPREVLDIALRHGLWVMVGLSAEQYAGYLIDRANAPDIAQIIRKKVRSVAGHPALLCYGLGNEIQAPVARWIGRRRLEKYLASLCKVVRSEDPGSLVTYVNYPSTEYLSLPFLDLLSFNVYLESQERLSSYLARLQNLAGDRPLIMGELGLDSMRNGEEGQAESVGWQIRTSFAEGCAGTFVFAWTDEWYRGKERVEDWAFGLTRLDRSAKPALAEASRAFSEAPFGSSVRCPGISVIVCTHNGSMTLRECLTGIAALNYPDYEVIVVDDGSRDQSAAIAAEFNVRLISTPNMGLSSARNTGLAAAKGEIVAYIDDDAVPDTDWLRYLAYSFERGAYGAVGGPNIAPGEEGIVANAVENAPGGPIHVLVSDRLAEHIPGCNMAFRRETLVSLGGFDTRFRTAGDDVDVCWRLLEKGEQIGFNPAAVVTHHRRKSLRAYWRQQWGYGKAEGQLEEKWPDKYNSAGHVTWGGRLYGKGLSRLPGFAGRIYHGVWGGAPFQLLYQQTPHGLASFPLMPEWVLLEITLGLTAILGLFWSPLLLAFPLFLLALTASLAKAGASALSTQVHRPQPESVGARTWMMTAVLFLLQPLARLGGRFRAGLTPWRTRTGPDLIFPWPKHYTLWTGQGTSQEDRLAEIEAGLHRIYARVTRGGPFDGWDLEVSAGLFGAARLRMAVEEHGGGSQFVRAHVWPQWRRITLFLVLIAFIAFLSASAHADNAKTIATLLWLVGLLVIARALYDFAGALTSLRGVAAEYLKEPRTESHT